MPGPSCNIMEYADSRRHQSPTISLHALDTRQAAWHLDEAAHEDTHAMMQNCTRSTPFRIAEIGYRISGWIFRISDFKASLVLRYGTKKRKIKK